MRSLVFCDLLTNLRSEEHFKLKIDEWGSSEGPLLRKIYAGDNIKVYPLTVKVPSVVDGKLVISHIP
jgi:hypothetical protein